MYTVGFVHYCDNDRWVWVVPATGMVLVCMGVGNADPQYTHAKPYTAAAVLYLVLFPTHLKSL